MTYPLAAERRLFVEMASRLLAVVEADGLRSSAGCATRRVARAINLDPPTAWVGELIWDYRSNGVRGVHLLLVLGRWHAVGEGDGEGVQGGLPPHGPSCLTGALGV